MGESTNQDYLYGRKDSVLCACKECGRMQGSHELLPLDAEEAEKYKDANPKPLGHCRICTEGLCVQK